MYVAAMTNTTSILEYQPFTEAFIDGSVSQTTSETNWTDYLNTSQNDSCDVDFQVLFYCRTILGAISLVGNLSFVFVVVRVRAMRTIPNFHFINLAAADTMMILTEIFYLILHRLMLGEKISFDTLMLLSDVFSKMWIFITPLFLCTALLTIALISIERYIAVCHPFKANILNLRSKKRVVILIAITWTVGILLGLFALYTFYYRSSEATLFAWFIVFTCFTVLPVFIVVACYGLVVANIFMIKRPDHQGGNSNNKGMRFSRSHSEERKVLVLCIAITLLFFLCFAPLAAIQLIQTYKTISGDLSIGRNTMSCLQTVQSLLLSIHLAISPMLYNCGSNIRRKAFKRAFCTCRSPACKGNKYCVYRESSFNRTRATSLRSSSLRMSRTSEI